MTDFEHVVIAAIQEIFPRTSSTGCFFYFKQCIWRKIQQISFVAAYEKENGTFTISARSLAALVFVPEQDVENAFDKLIIDKNFDHRVQPIADYFE